MNDTDPILIATRAIIERIAGSDRTPADCGPDTPLADGFWLDSVELVDVLVACEQEFGIIIDDDMDVRSGAFGTLGSLADLIRSKQAARRQNS
jgi:acyl carrier protein